MAEDEALVRGGLCALLELEADMELAGEAADGAAAVMIGDAAKIAAIHAVQPLPVHVEAFQGLVRRFRIDGIDFQDMGEIAHTTEKPARNPWRPTRASSDLTRAIFA